MSGHSKWASIKHKKAAADSKRGASFTKLANTVTVAAKQGGGDPEMNPGLRLAIEKARAANMPKDNIERAIKRGTGEGSDAIVEEVLYEGFGPGGVAMLIEALTDNRNRANSDIRTIMMKNGGRIPEGGGVAYQFGRKGVIRAEVSAGKELVFEELVIESGAEDYSLEEGNAVVYVEVPQLHSTKDALDAAGFKVSSAEVEYVANMPIEIDDAELEKVANLIELLEENDDVTSVYTNLKE